MNKSKFDSWGKFKLGGKWEQFDENSNEYRLWWITEDLQMLNYKCQNNRRRKKIVFSKIFFNFGKFWRLESETNFKTSDRFFD